MKVRDLNNFRTAIGQRFELLEVVIDNCIYEIEILYKDVLMAKSVEFEFNCATNDAAELWECITTTIAKNPQVTKKKLERLYWEKVREIDQLKQIVSDVQHKQYDLNKKLKEAFKDEPTLEASVCQDGIYLKEPEKRSDQSPVEHRYRSFLLCILDEYNFFEIKRLVDKFEQAVDEVLK